MEVKLIEPYGYCHGVNIVIEKLNKIIKSHPQNKIFCVGQIVHNKLVNDAIKAMGVTILEMDKSEAVDSIDSGVVVFSAHGTDAKIVNKAKEKGLIVYDLVCGFVLKSFSVIKKAISEGHDIIYIGVNNHEESKAALSIDKSIHFVTSLNDVEKLNITNNKISVINQTTLSILDIKDIYNKILEKYPYANIVDEICNSTRIRQQNILDKRIDSEGVIVVGDKNSNNAKSLYKICLQQGYNTIFVRNFNDIDEHWICNKKSVSIVSGASTPTSVVMVIYQKLKNINKN